RHAEVRILPPQPNLLIRVRKFPVWWRGEFGLLQPHHNAVGRAAGVHYLEPHEAGPLRLEEQRAPSRRSRQWLPVDQHGQRSGAPVTLSAIGSGLPEPSLASSSLA